MVECNAESKVFKKYECFYTSFPKLSTTSHMRSNVSHNFTLS